MATETYDVFVSYSRADWRHAADIDSALRAKGLKPFFDRRNLAPGLPWVRALEQAIGAAKAAIVLIGPHGFGNTQQYERELAIFRQSRDSTFPVVPVLLPDTPDPPFSFLQVLTWVDFSHVAKVSDAPLELLHLLTAVRGGRISGDVVRDAICPYRGLDAFREEDAAFFFGRGNADDPKSAIGELVGKVREHPFVMVVGRSGSGKSSLINAGLLPALRRERDQFWNVLSLRPGPAPLRSLAAAFNPRTEGEGAADYATKITNEADKLRTGDPELLSHMIRAELDQAEGKPDRLLLCIDQWEELYAQAPPSTDRERAAQHAADVNRFIDLLLIAARTAPVAVVGTVRADFYDPLIAHEEIKSLLPSCQVLLGKMQRSDLEQTIVEPARQVGLVFDPPDLVQRILDEAGEDEGMLPLLHARHALETVVGEVTDNSVIRLRQMISDRYGVDMLDKSMRDAVVSLALDHSFDPVRDMLDRAEGEWDGVQRLDGMAATYFNCANTRLNRAIVRKTMIAAVRRVRQPGVKFDNILVMESEEGWEKSTAWRVLAGDENFSDASILGRLGAREVQEQLSEVWIHENADLAGMKTAEVETVKAFASRQSDDARPAYGHFLKKQKRHSIEVGTTNSFEYLHSRNGNRRFWPLKILRPIDIEQLKRDRLQLWGEAARYESAGESIVLERELWPAAGRAQEKRLVKDPWEDVLGNIPSHAYLDEHKRVELLYLKQGDEVCSFYIQIRHLDDSDCGDGEWVEIVTSADLLRYVLGIPVDRQTPAHGMRLADVMKKLQWERGNDGRVYVNDTQARGYSRKISKADAKNYEWVPKEPRNAD